MSGLERYGPVRRGLPAALLGGLVVPALVLAGCGGGSDEDAAATTAATAEAPVPEITVPAEVVDLSGQSTVTVEVTDNAFTPSALRVAPGTEIVFTNEGLNHHNVTPAEEGTFETIATDALDPGETASLTVGDEGTYGFYCTLHGTPTRGQNGVFVVGTG